MTQQPAYDFAATAIKALRSHGWTTHPHHHTAHKEFETAAGMKVATARVSEWAESRCFQLAFEYQSEGRNVCATSSALVSYDVDQATAVASIEASIAAAQRAIDGSYARKLHLSHTA